MEVSRLAVYRWAVCLCVPDALSSTGAMNPVNLSLEIRAARFLMSIRSMPATLNVSFLEGVA